jgi:hypothetical protein
MAGVVAPVIAGRGIAGVWGVEGVGGEEDGVTVRGGLE